MLQNSNSLLVQSFGPCTPFSYSNSRYYLSSGSPTMTPDYRYPPASQLFSSPSDSFYPDTLAPGGRRDQQDTPESCSFPATVVSPQSAASGARAAVYPFMLSKIQPSQRYSVGLIPVPNFHIADRSCEPRYLAVSAQFVYGGPYGNIPVLASVPFLLSSLRQPRFSRMCTLSSSYLTLLPIWI